MDGKPRLLAQVREQIRPNTTLFVPNASIENGGMALTTQPCICRLDRPTGRSIFKATGFQAKPAGWLCLGDRRFEANRGLLLGQLQT